MTIVIFYHLSEYKCFKFYYHECSLAEGKSYFRDAVSYNRFIEIKKTVYLPLDMFIFASAGESLPADIMSIQQSFLLVITAESIFIKSSKRNQTGKNVHRMVLWNEIAFDY